MPSVARPDTRSLWWAKFDGRFRLVVVDFALEDTWLIAPAGTLGASLCGAVWTKRGCTAYVRVDDPRWEWLEQVLLPGAVAELRDRVRVLEGPAAGSGDPSMPKRLPVGTVLNNYGVRVVIIADREGTYFTVPSRQDVRAGQNLVVSRIFDPDPLAAGWVIVPPSAQANISQPEKAPFVCRYCGAPSYIDQSDQDLPADLCHPENHGEPP